MPLLTPCGMCWAESAADSWATWTVPVAGDRADGAGRHLDVEARHRRVGDVQRLRRGGLAEARRGRPVDHGQDQGRGDDVVGAGVEVVAQQLGHRRRQVQPALRRADRPARADRAGVGRDAGEREVARRIGDGRGSRRS